jgi:hypothetical protein
MHVCARIRRVSQPLVRSALCAVCGAQPPSVEAKKETKLEKIETVELSTTAKARAKANKKKAGDAGDAMADDEPATPAPPSAATAAGEAAGGAGGDAGAASGDSADKKDAPAEGASRAPGVCVGGRGEEGGRVVCTCGACPACQLFCAVCVRARACVSQWSPRLLRCTTPAG